MNVTTVVCGKKNPEASERTWQSIHRTRRDDLTDMVVSVERNDPYLDDYISLCRLYEMEGLRLWIVDGSPLDRAEFTILHEAHQAQSVVAIAVVEEGYEFKSPGWDVAVKDMMAVGATEVTPDGVGSPTFRHVFLLV